MTTLADRPLLPVAAGAPRLDAAALTAALAELPAWQVTEGRLRRRLATADFAAALAHAVRVGMLAEHADHHPELTVRWGELVIEVWTHSIGGLSAADVIFAARCDRVLP